MSETGEVIIDKDSGNNMENFDAFDDPHEEPTILHTKKFRIGSGNIIGKRVIQDFFTCASAWPLWVDPFFIELVVLRMLYLCS